MDAKELIRRYRTLKGERGAREGHWEDLARVLLPRRTGFTSERYPGDRPQDDLFDGSPMRAARGLSNAIGGMLRPDGQKWLFMRANDDAVDQDGEARDWIGRAEERLIDALYNPKARFRQATGDADLDLSVFGTAALFVGERSKLDGLMFQAIHLKDAVAFFSEDGEPEGMFRTRRFTLRQAANRFGKDKLSEDSRKKLEKKQEDDRVLFLHAVLPRGEGKADALLARNLPFASVWIEMDAAHEVQSGGFHEFPFVVPRWDTSSGEDYGDSPGMIALPDANTLQAMGETILIAGQRAAAPPLLAPNDGFFDEANMFPDGITYYDADIAKDLGRIPVAPLESGTNLPISRDMQQDTREQVFAAFFRNVLNLPVDGPEMTATEVIQRKEEFIREIGPVFGRLESDYTAPMVERAFSIMLRAGALPPIPEVLQNQSIRFEYESPVKKIRQQVEAAAARMWVAEHIEAANATGRPEILDKVNFDAYSDFAAEASGIPHIIVNSNDQVAVIRQARMEAQQQAQEAAQIQQAAEIADTAAGAANKAGLVDA